MESLVQASAADSIPTSGDASSDATKLPTVWQDAKAHPGIWITTWRENLTGVEESSSKTQSSCSSCVLSCLQQHDFLASACTTLPFHTVGITSTVQVLACPEVLLSPLMFQLLLLKGHTLREQMSNGQKAIWVCFEGWLGNPSLIHPPC